MDKRVASVGEALAGLSDGATVLVGGFGVPGVPQALIAAMLERGVRDLVLVANGVTSFDALIAAGRVRKVICSFPRGDAPGAFEAAYKAGKVELEIVPQGTLSERVRAAAAGIGGYFTRVSVGTRLAEGKEVREIGGALHVLERPISGDMALIKAQRGDRWGNLVYRKSARNFNPVMAMAGRVTVAQVADIVELGELDPEYVHTPGIFVDRIVKV